ncbi:DUF4142 domain-containing protein (plasmid) [Kovacikia minuta CCNUW1]|uniref:DUF4142 domain-containing protein n=1 Tax=Kovacikia minuta TaxID=2931930 RepID=UPI001CCF0EF4|nr:DUF4142 domain-containing protein [Kovacikia minuta]UBF30279.1 DUF4142 domain-containing protein [Kovacikia minuta CCNUW1]
MFKVNLPIIVFSAIAVPILSSCNAPPQADQSTNQPTQSPAQLTQASPTAEPSAERLSDQQFATKVAQSDRAEITLGRLASQKATNAEVKKYGQMMAQDHTKTTNQLKQLANQKKLTLPTDMGAEHKAAQRQLSQLSGAAFDRQYMHQMVKDHQKAIALFQQEAQEGENAALKAWASKTLPALEEHLNMATSLERTVSQSSTK